MKKRVVVILLAIILAVVIIGMVCTYALKQNQPNEIETLENSEEDVAAEEEDLSAWEITTFLAEDFSDSKIEWFERKYDLITHKNSWYRNGGFYRSGLSRSAEDILYINLNGDTVSYEVELPEPSYQIVYEMKLEESRQYLLGLLQNGMKLRRILYDSGCIDVYLLDEDGGLVRALVTKTAMILDRMEESTELPTIEEIINGLEKE